MYSKDICNGLVGQIDFNVPYRKHVYVSALALRVPEVADLRNPARVGGENTSSESCSQLLLIN